MAFQPKRAVATWVRRSGKSNEVLFSHFAPNEETRPVHVKALHVVGLQLHQGERCKVRKVPTHPTKMRVHQQLRHPGHRLEMADCTKINEEPAAPAVVSKAMAQHQPQDEHRWQMQVWIVEGCAVWAHSHCDITHQLGTQQCGSPADWMITQPLRKGKYRYQSSVAQRRAV